MIKIEKTEIIGFDAAIRGMRNPMDSWYRSDSDICIRSYYKPKTCKECPHSKFCNSVDIYAGSKLIIGPNDHALAMRLRDAGTDHRKFMRMIIVTTDILAPLYWWKEFDTYKVGTVANSCSTMHKIQDTPINPEAFSLDHTILCEIGHKYLNELDRLRVKYLETGNKAYWYALIQLLPESFNQRRTVMMSYEVLANIYKSRKDHKLDEWRVGFMDWIRSLPYSELITG